MAEPLAVTTAITVSVPAYKPGDTYKGLVEGTGNLLNPLETVLNRATGLVDTDPVIYAHTITADVSVLWAYLDYGQKLEPALVSFRLLLLAYLAVMVVKLILAVVLYVKNIVANWL